MYAFCKIPTSSKLPAIPPTHIKDAEQRFFVGKISPFFNKEIGELLNFYYFFPV
jgi:hypothetical protein